MSSFEIEPGIRPLVDALQEHELVQTFSSCEGHFAPDEQHLRDRNHAEIRFVPRSSTSPAAYAAVDRWLGTWLARFKARHGLMPVTVAGYRLFTPLDDAVIEETYVVEVRPFNRFELPATKRADVDRAVRQLVALIPPNQADL